MALDLHCYGLDHITMDPDAREGLAKAVLREGQPYAAYRGVYINKWFGDLQIVANIQFNEEIRQMEAVRFMAHNAGDCICPCRVVESVTPPGRDILSRTLMIAPVHGNAAAVAELVNAEVLPSYATNEIIDLQLVLKTSSIRFYPDEETFEASRGSRCALPGGSADGKLKTVSLAADTLYPIGFLSNRPGGEEKPYPGEDGNAVNYLRGPVRAVSRFTAAFNPVDPGQTAVWWSCRVETGFGEIDVMFCDGQVAEEERPFVREGCTVSAVGVLQGDTFAPHVRGIRLDRESGYRLVRYVLQLNGDEVLRLQPALSENCRYRSESMKRDLRGARTVAEYLAETSRLMVGRRKYWSYYGTITEVTGEEGDEPLPHQVGERCIVLAHGSEKAFTQIVFLGFDREGKIDDIYLSSSPRYRFRTSVRWEPEEGPDQAK